MQLVYYYLGVIDREGYLIDETEMLLAMVFAQANGKFSNFNVSQLVFAIGYSERHCAVMIDHAVSIGVVIKESFTGKYRLTSTSRKYATDLTGIVEKNTLDLQKAVTLDCSLVGAYDYDDIPF